MQRRPTSPCRLYTRYPRLTAHRNVAFEIGAALRKRKRGGSLIVNLPERKGNPDPKPVHLGVLLMRSRCQELQPVGVLPKMVAWLLSLVPRRSPLAAGRPAGAVARVARGLASQKDFYFHCKFPALGTSCRGMGHVSVCFSVVGGRAFGALILMVVIDSPRTREMAWVTRSPSSHTISYATGGLLRHPIMPLVRRSPTSRCLRCRVCLARLP